MSEETIMAMMSDEQDIPPIISMSSWGAGGGKITAPRPGQDLPNYMRLDIVREIATLAWQEALSENLGRVADALRASPSPQANMAITQIEMTLRRDLKKGPSAETLKRIEEKITEIAFARPNSEDCPSP
ncbi:MAG: hypothetical protein ABJN42_20960 [Roseibium sp.]|uniref:hypothetical protein n=1 Tax=Roseibium sp. TaxID=1936156 RepID=UPI00329A616C